MITSRPELLEHLSEQLSFLSSSCDAFDQGNRSEAKRIATQIRVLVHDTTQSHSLLKQLGIKSTMQFVWSDTPGRIAELKRSDVAFGGLFALTAGTHSYAPVEFREGSPTGFEEWWKKDAVLLPGGQTYTRRQLVLWVTNKDGGAHIDDLPPGYRSLAKEGLAGWRRQTQGGSYLETESPVPSCIRTIGSELLRSIHAYGP
ncbi:hypothetical protein [Arthrobacter sp. SAFR-014]|uniref:hypothetical protein n=1 Tax=unclassified Arthrobacter TaxID=235627 RepID=UPI003F7C93F9